jgi:hypothetical protein
MFPNSHVSMSHVPMFPCSHVQKKCSHVPRFSKMVERGHELTCLHSELRYTALHGAACFGQTKVRCVCVYVYVCVYELRYTVLHAAACLGQAKVSVCMCVCMYMYIYMFPPKTPNACKIIPKPPTLFGNFPKTLHSWRKFPPKPINPPPDRGLYNIHRYEPGHARAQVGVICRMSYVTCHMSSVICHMSYVICHICHNNRHNYTPYKH